jgi:hypothetical protein
MTSRMKVACVLLIAGVAAGCTDDASQVAGDNGRPAPAMANASSTPDAKLQASSQTASGVDIVGRHPSRATTSMGTHASRRYLRAEGAFVTGNAVSVQKAGDAIMSREFTKVVRGFERDLAADSEARDLTDLYRRAMDEQAKGLGHVTELACGLSVCIGAIRTPDDAHYQQWLARFDADRRTPSYSYGEVAMDVGQAGLETRFYFSIDPSLNGVVAPAGPFKPPAS